MKVLLLAVLFLAGCAGTAETIKPPADNDRKIHIDERLLVECPPFGDIKDNPQPSDVLQQHKTDTVMYKDCADGKKALIQVIRKAFE